MSFTNDKDSDNYATDKMGYDLIIDNPPFSKFKPICQKLKKLNKPFILMCPSKTFNLKHFQNAFKEHLQIIIPNKRPTFTHLTHPKKGYTPPFGTSYYCYKMNLQKDLNFI